MFRRTTFDFRRVTMKNMEFTHNHGGKIKIWGHKRWPPRTIAKLVLVNQGLYGI
jgi:hypothetical protein